MWDLHIHSPGTKLNDQYTVSGGDVWDEYCRQLEDSEVQVFGITDYFSAEGYLTATAAFSARYPDSHKLLLPNVELRTTDVVNKQQEEVNIHILFNPSWANHRDKLKAFLHELKTSKTEPGGREVRADELQSRSDFEEATTTRQFIRAALEATYGKDAGFLEYVVIVTAANNDGIRPSRGKKRKKVITDEVDKFSDAFFGNAGNVAYFLRTDRAEDKSEKTKPKPVLSGSDARSFADLDDRLGLVVTDHHGIAFEPTWIKADPTYEGLKQIIFEPANRVYIGEEPEVERRVREHKTRYIESLGVSCREGYNPDQFGTWFHQESIPLNKEMVAIIGNKGSGKSAVTDLIGLLGNSHHQTRHDPDTGREEELFSFLNREKFLKGGCAAHFAGTLNWYEGEPDRRELHERVTLHLPQKVEYLPQKYLERLCADISDDEFRETLNEVIFRYVEPKDRYGQTSLSDLIQYLTQQAEEDIAQAEQEVHEANVAVIVLERKLTQEYRQELEEKVRLKKEEVQAHEAERPAEKEKPSESESSESGSHKELSRLAERLVQLAPEIERLEKEQAQAKQAATDLRQLRHAIARQAGALRGLEFKHKAILDAAELKFDDIVSLAVDYGPLDAVVQRHEARTAEIDLLLISREEIDDSDWDETEQEEVAANSLRCRQSILEAERTALVDRLGRPQREYQQYLKELELWKERQGELLGDEGDPEVDTLRWLERELVRCETTYAEQLVDARVERMAKSKSIFQKKLDLTSFYNQVKEAIDRQIDECREELGEYNIAIGAGLRFKRTFADDFFGFVSQSAAGSFRGLEEGRERLRRLWEGVSDWQNDEEVFAALDSIVDALHVDQREDVTPLHAPRNVFSQMKSQRSVQDLYDFLFSFEYLEPKYDLKVDQKDLSELSPGERGGLLLIFYLMLDRQDRPLVIDQPEDNLDNKSVYEILVTFIKEAKKRRQIILVTHNPNLAVVADAEQILHVSLDKKDGKNDFDFFSGAIEAPHVNRVLVDILEGTLPAFDNRRLKYRKHDGSAVV